MWGSAPPVSAPSGGSFLDAKRGRTWVRFDTDWGWPGKPNDLPTTVNSFVQEVHDYPDRITALELFGA